MLGLKCVGPNTEMVERLRRCGLLTVGAGDNVVRLLPPLIISGSEIDQALDMLDRVAAQEAKAAERDACQTQQTETAPRHFLDLDRLSKDDLRKIIDVSRALKAGTHPFAKSKPLAGKTLAMIFEKPSTRTRVSFELGMKQLGGDAVVLERESSQLGRGETVADTARVLSRYVDCIMVRTTKEEKLQELAEYRQRAGHQRPHRPHPSLPADGRRHDLRGASRADRGQAHHLVRRRQQHGDLVDPRRGDVRLRAERRLPGDPAAAAGRGGLGAGARRQGAHRHRPDRGGGRRRLRRHRHLGLDGRCGHLGPPQHAARASRSTTA